jgi:aminopeptidase N
MTDSNQNSSCSQKNSLKEEIPSQKLLERHLYEKPSFRIPKTSLFFKITTEKVLVTATLELCQEENSPINSLADSFTNSNSITCSLTPSLTDSLMNSVSAESPGSLSPSFTGVPKSLFLHGKNLSLLEISINEKPLSPQNYTLTEEGLLLHNPQSSFTLCTTVELHPKENTHLEGLYSSGRAFLTQCEPQGFRRITFYLDRPDVMSSFFVEIQAPEKDFPVLLSNGNCLESENKEGLLTVKWEDPFLKPCYLFALVAGSFECLKKSYVTQSQRSVQLEAYVRPGQLLKASFALDSLEKAMRWDETRFGLEYDLHTYMIVATDDFNSGAMENKGLNVFNSLLVLANPQTATDENYFHIESVVAHEYFHNWSGNRVTLRDWFNLSLKEGLTVFRDQEFSMDTFSLLLYGSLTYKDSNPPSSLEDQGPNAHPVYPESGYSVDNFFTTTIYEKGAEIIRMVQTILGRPLFNEGLKMYFQKFDGQAVTIEDLIHTLFDSYVQNPQHHVFNLEQFKLWYSQYGTPQVTIETHYDKDKKLLKFVFTKSTNRNPRINQNSLW